MKTIASCLVLLFVVACGGQEILTPEKARTLIVDATVTPKAALDEVARAGAAWHPGTASNLTFSLLLNAVPMGDSDDLRRLRTKDSAPPSPDELWIRSGAGQVTMLTEDHLSEVTVEMTEGAATGTFRFRRENLMEGRGTFSARRGEDGWSVVVLGLPAIGASVARNQDGTWGLVGN